MGYCKRIQIFLILIDKALNLCELKNKNQSSNLNPQTMKSFHFGENLRMMRNFRGLTQEVMAKDLNMSQGTYSKIEYNQDLPEAEMICRLAEILQFEPDEFRSTSWYADQYNGSEKMNQTFMVLKRYGQIGYIVLLLVAWLDMSMGFIDGAEIQSIDLKLLTSMLIGAGVFCFHYYSVKEVEMSVEEEGDYGEDVGGGLRGQQLK